MYTPNNPEDTRQVQACKMRAEGQSVRAVADHFGVGYNAVRIWTDPKAREARKAYRRRTVGPETNKKYALKTLYGITPEDFEKMLSDQDNKCAICGCSPDKTMHVDHCHKTGKVRALLCSPCNTGIGSLKEDPEILRAALGYLKKHNTH